MKNLLYLSLIVIYSSLILGCGKEPTVNNSNTSNQGLEVLPWEIDLTIDGNRIHWKSIEIETSSGAYLDQFSGFEFGANNKLSKNYFSGEEIAGKLYGLDLENLGIQNVLLQLIIGESNKVSFVDSIQIDVVDWGDPFEINTLNTPFIYVNGKKGEINIPNQKVMYPIDRVSGKKEPKEFYGKLVFYRKY